MPIKIKSTIRNKKHLMSDKEYLMSDDVYLQLIDDFYPKGTLLRLINGVDDNETIGYHFNKEYVTVIPVMSDTARWIGMRKTEIVKVGKLKHLPSFLKDEE